MSCGSSGGWSAGPGLRSIPLPESVDVGLRLPKEGGPTAYANSVSALISVVSRHPWSSEVPGTGSDGYREAGWTKWLDPEPQPI